MASPEWFFSTLAQSSAALIGFIIAIATVQYQFERRRIDKRTEELRDELRKMKNKYRSIFTTISITLDDKGFDILANNHIHEYNKELTELVDEIHSGKYENPRVIETAAYLARIGHLISQIKPSDNPRENYLIRKDKITELSELGIGMLIWFSTLESQRKDGKSGIDFSTFPSSTFAGRVDEDGTSISELAHELGINEEIEYTTDFFEEDGFTTGELNEITQFLDEHFEPENHTSPLTGTNLISLNRIFLQFENDMSNVRSKQNDTLLDYEPKIKPILKISVWLAVAGVFLPTLALSTVPTEFYLTGWALLVLEVGLVIAVVILLGMIVQKLASSIAYGSSSLQLLPDFLTGLPDRIRAGIRRIK
jgi:hypothetical protein